MDLRSAAFFNGARAAFPRGIVRVWGQELYAQPLSVRYIRPPAGTFCQGGGRGFPLTDIILRTKSRAIRAQRRAEDITGTNAKRLTLEDQPPAI